MSFNIHSLSLRTVGKFHSQPRACHSFPQADLNCPGCLARLELLSTSFCVEIGGYCSIAPSDMSFTGLKEEPTTQRNWSFRPSLEQSLFTSTLGSLSIFDINFEGRLSMLVPLPRAGGIDMGLAQSLSTSSSNKCFRLPNLTMPPTLNASSHCIC